MSRINNNSPAVQTPKSQPKTKNEAQQAANKGVFANKMKKQEPKKKTGSNNAKTSSGLSAKKDGESTAMLKRHGGAPVMSRGKGGTVADLQARLENQGGVLDKGAGKGLGGEKGLGLGLDKEGMGKDLVQEPNADAAALHAGIGGMKDGSSIPQGGEFQIRGAKIPNAMLDKMVDHARVGVNGAGNPEMQFDLKGDVLGGMKMRMSMENGQLKAIFVAENPEVRKFIDGNLADLRKQLEDRGLVIRELEVRDPKEDQRQRQREQNQKERRESWDQ